MTPAIAPPPTAAPPGAADLLLVRLLPATKNPPAAKAVRGALDKLLPRPLGSEEWAELVARLRRDGMLGAGLRLSDAGRARALAFLGVAELPAGIKWQAIVSVYLFPKATGATPAAGEKKTDKNKLAARLLKRQEGLPVGAEPTLTQVFDALVCRELGFPGLADLGEVRRRVLGRLCESDGPVSAEQAAAVLPTKLLKLPAKWNAEVLRHRIVADWLAHAAEPEPTPPPDSEPERTEFDLPAFAATVRAAARHVGPSGRYGQNKVFISHLWRYLRNEPTVPRLDLDEFKRRLVEASSAGLLELTRADLVQDMDPADVRESETAHLHATYHFVTVE